MANLAANLQQCWASNWKTHEHPVACSCQTPLKQNGLFDEVFEKNNFENNWFILSMDYVNVINHSQV